MTPHSFIEWVSPSLLPGESVKGGAGSGNYGHQGRPGKVGGSASHSGGPQAGVANALVDDAPKPRMRPIHARREAAILMRQRAIEDRGFTYQPLLKTSPTRGMAISIYPDREAIFNPLDLSAESLQSYIDENLDLLADPLNHIGGWYNPDDGKIYIDISRVVQSRREATRLCREYQQYAFYDLGTGEQVNVEGARKEPATTKGKGQGPIIRFELPNNPTPEELAEAVSKLRQLAGVEKPQDNEVPNAIDAANEAQAPQA